MDRAVDEMELTTLIDMNAREPQPHWDKEALDDGYALNLLHRALEQRSDEAWSQLEHYFSQFIRKWLHSHPSRDVALLRDSEENYIAQTFSRFWYAMHTQQLEFTTVYAALRYLRATLNGLLIDTLRCHLRGRAREVPIPMEASSLGLLAQDSMDEQSIWQSIESLLHDERERRLAYLLYYCGLKPKEIVARCSQEFDDVKEIYRLSHNIIERLRRNRDRLRLLLGLEA